ncbi:MAG: LPS export ABC transporter permease LptF [Acetobacteraceae bacterium]
MARPLITRLDRYVFRQLLLALIATTCGLVALIWLTQSLRFVQLVIDRGLSAQVFLELTGLLVPNFVAVILPITTFVVVQFVYHRLAGDRELTVMRAAGLSDFALARPALVLATLSVIACYALNIWVVPASFGAFRDFEFEIRNRMAAFLLQEGVFTPISDQLTVYVRRKDPDGTLHGILVDDARQPNAHATILAQRGRLMSGPAGPRVLLEDGSREQIDRQTGRLDVLTFAQNVIDLSESGSNGPQRYRDASEMSLTELLHPAAFVTNPRDIGKFEVEAHRRLAMPFTAVSFALIALLAVLSGTFRRHGGLVRPLAAVGAVVGLLALQLVVQNLAARVPALIPLIYVVAILPGLAAAAALLRPRGRRAARPAVLGIRTA